MLKIMPEIFKLSSFHRGWVVGDFSPSIFRLSECEVSVMHHLKKELTQPHYHTSSKEINVVVSGKVLVNGMILESNDIFVYNAYEISEVEFIEDTTLCIIRVPSSPNDKIIVGIN